MSKILKQLKQLKYHGRIDQRRLWSVEASWERIAEAIGAHDEHLETAPSTAAMLTEYVRWNAAQYVSRPIVAGAFSLMMVASGWITTASAADSLPGDKLYSVKMLTERTQLRLASLDKKAVLHTEFAERRLQEAAQLQVAAAQDVTRAPLVKETIAASRQEMASAGENLRQLRDSGDESTLAVAASVQLNLEAIDVAIDAVVAESESIETTQDVLQAKEVTKEVGTVATTVVVEVHEEAQTEVSSRELKEMFKRDLGKIEARQRFDLERIEVIRTALADETVSYEGFTVPTGDELIAYEYTITAVDTQLSQAMNNFAAGGYRDAFATLQEIDAALLQVEASLAQIEITIMTARATPPPAVEETDTDSDAVETAVPDVSSDESNEVGAETM